jgi:hypothetical protein
VLKNNTYPLSVSAERLSQALHIAEHAQKLNADAVAHGSTGAGNDQVRFDMIFHIMIPGVEIITPIRDLQLSREAEIAYLKEKGVQMNFEKALYSINKGLWGTSVGGRETLSSNGMLPESAWPTQVTKSGDEEVILSFDKGELRGVNERTFDILRSHSIFATTGWAIWYWSGYTCRRYDHRYQRQSRLRSCRTHGHPKGASCIGKTRAYQMATAMERYPVSILWKLVARRSDS